LPFITGTAAGATPITELAWQDKKAVFGDGRPGELTVDIHNTLKGIQYGTLPDTEGWMVRV
jgi:branched-chain amino acid aminotransferase